jgi:hypothetical protein
MQHWPGVLYSYMENSRASKRQRKSDSWNMETMLHCIAIN